MFDSVVVAYDGSGHAAKALEIGATLAARDQASLGIIYAIDVEHMQLPVELRRMGEVEHIIEPMPNFQVDMKDAPHSLTSTMAQTSADSEKAMLRFADYLVEQAQKSARTSGVKDTDARAVLGSPAEEVVDYAKARNADLIICGSRGFGRLKSLLLGSTSQKIAQLAECSCLTIR
ncbi:MAG: universal stress protein [Gammaproteobacteria bacterium]|nr:universal stress protein [Gammaproteobacteria bacterium]